MSMTNIVLMDNKQLDFLLTNYEFFSDKEIQLAAKRKVQMDKIPAYGLSQLDAMEREGAFYDQWRRSIDMQNRGLSEALNSVGMAFGAWGAYIGSTAWSGR